MALTQAQIEAEAKAARRAALIARINGCNMTIAACEDMIRKYTIVRDNASSMIKEIYDTGTYLAKAGNNCGNIIINGRAADEGKCKEANQTIVKWTGSPGFMAIIIVCDKKIAFYEAKKAAAEKERNELQQQLDNGDY